MIDTVVYICLLKLLERRWPQGWRGWKPITGDDPLRDGRDKPQSGHDYWMNNELLGVRVFIHADVITKVEVDLPKLLFGHNGRLIKSQAEVDLALARLAMVLKTFCKPLGEHNGYYPGEVAGDFWTYYTRTDLVWQFDLEPAFVLLAMRNAKHPEINKRTGEWSGQTLAFPGTKIRISMYDKKAKMHARCRHHVMRVEVQLSDEKISEHYGLGDGFLKGLSLDAAYSAYRDTLLKFGTDRVPDPNAKGKNDDFLAWVVTKLPYDDPVGVYCLTKKLCPRVGKALRKSVGQRVPSLVALSWKALLPTAHLPPVVELVSGRKESRVESYFDELARWQPISMPDAA